MTIPPRWVAAIAILGIGALSTVGCGNGTGRPADGGAAGVSMGGHAGSGSRGGAGMAGAGAGGGSGGVTTGGGGGGGSAGPGSGGGGRGAFGGAGGLGASGGGGAGPGGATGAGGRGGVTADGGAGGATGGSAAGGVAGSGAGGVAGAPGQGGAGGAGGGGAVSYTGCSFGGDIDRISVAKRDAARNLCVVIVFADAASTKPPGVTLPPNWRVEFAFTTSPAGTCKLRFPPAGAVNATSQTGMASWTTGTSAPFTTADVDMVLHFTGDGGAIPDETIRATGVDVSSGC